MRVLVTGSEGFIGSHVVEDLVRTGHQVRAMYLYNSLDARGWLEDLSADIRESIEEVAGDVRDQSSTDRLIDGCDAVVHLAALIGIPYSFDAPSSYVQTNLVGTLNVLEACRRHAVQRIVQTSTSEVFGSAQFVPMTESHRLMAQSPYAASKIAADQLAISYFHSFETPVVVVRPFNTYGPRQSLRAVIPQIIVQLLRDPDRVQLGNVETVRDLTFVSDTARAFSLALLSDAAVGQQINLGTGIGVTIREIVDCVASILGVEPSLDIDPSRLRPGTSEVERLVSSNALAGHLLGWTPEVGGREGLERGLRRTIDWFKPQIDTVKRVNGYVK